MSNYETKLSEYIQNKFAPAVVLFNYIGGVHVDRINTLEEAVEKTITHLKVTHEEWIENMSAIGMDVEQELDGMVDQMFTFPYLDGLIYGLNDKFDGYIDQIKRSPYFRAIAAMEACINVTCALQEAFIPVEIFIEACDRVIDNNMSKFTTDKEYALTWELPEGCTLTSQEYKGDVYWYIVNADGKVKKRIGFEPVDLSDLVAKIIEYNKTLPIDDEDDNDE